MRQLLLEGTIQNSGALRDQSCALRPDLRLIARKPSSFNS